MKKLENIAKYIAIDELKQLENNPRQIKKADFERLKESVKKNDKFFEAHPIIASDRTGENVIIAGNMRHRAAKELGMTEVPAVILHDLTEEQEREIIIRSNVENGEWDYDMLANEWDIDQLQDWGVSDVKPFKEIVEDDPAPVDDENTYSIIGDIYQLGEHRIFCGSFDDDEKVRELFGNKKATCTFTDPPYNVAVKNRTTGKTIQNDNMGHAEFQDLLNRAMECVAANMVPGGGVISWMSDKELFTLWDAFKKSGLEFKQTILWVKDHFVMGRKDYQFQSEPAIYGINEGKFDKDTDEDEGESLIAVYARSGGKFQQNRKISNTWFFERPAASKDHPTMKPVGLCAKGILSLSEEGDIVFDPFSGSGSTLIACEQTGRKCYGCEIDPKYCDVIRKRYWKFKTGDEEGWQEGTKAIR